MATASDYRKMTIRQLWEVMEELENEKQLIGVIIHEKFKFAEDTGIPQ